MKRIISVLLLLPLVCTAQPDFGNFPPPDGAAGGFRMGPPPGMMQQEIKLVSQFDKDANGWLDTAERKLARAHVADVRSRQPQRGPMGRGPGGPGGRRENQPAPSPGAKMSPSDVESFPDAAFYDTGVLRTLFLEFEGADWEKELEDFHNTDVEVPARLTADGKSYSGVGVHFRGASSYMSVGSGRKRSLNLSMDFVDENQRLHGRRTLNLLNSNDDPTFLRAVLYSRIAGEYIPTPKANYVRVVINGECWGIYVSVEQFNKDFTQSNFGSSKGARWKVPGSPQGRGGLEYLGEDAEAYKKIYEIKSKDDTQSWTDFIRLCRVLNKTSSNELEKALSPLLDIDGALKFLALENALVNNDGYWVRASDYSIYQDTGGKFHILPHDFNETFSLPGGPGMGGPGGRSGGNDSSRRINGVELHPLHAANDSSKPLLSKLLAVPSLKARYLAYVREIATKWLDWKTLEPMARAHHALIAADVMADTRKLDSFEAFEKGVAGETVAAGEQRPGPRRISLKEFAEKRRAYLLQVTASPEHAALKSTTVAGSP